MPNVDANLAHERIITMRDLSQNTSGVIGEVVEAGQPAFLTKRGQFIAMIVPFAPGQVERRVLEQLVDELGSADADHPGADTAYLAAMSEVDLDETGQGSNA